MFTIDAHLDLSMNALEWNRDLTQEVSAINQREAGLTDKPDRALATVDAVLSELAAQGITLVGLMPTGARLFKVQYDRYGIHSLTLYLSYLFFVSLPL